MFDKIERIRRNLGKLRVFQNELNKFLKLFSIENSKTRSVIIVFQIIYWKLMLMDRAEWVLTKFHKIRGEIFLGDPSPPATF